MCKGAVKKQGYIHPDPFQKWAKTNAEKPVACLPSVRKHGFYIVLMTYTAKDIFVNAMMSEGHKVSLGFKAAVKPGAELTSAAEFYGADSASGWVKPICKGQEEKVVFFSGLKYDYHKLTGWMRGADRKVREVPPEKWAGDNNIIADPECEADGLEIIEVSIGGEPEEEDEDEDDF